MARIVSYEARLVAIEAEIEALRAQRAALSWRTPAYWRLTRRIGRLGDRAMVLALSKPIDVTRTDTCERWSAEIQPPPGPMP